MTSRPRIAVLGLHLEANAFAPPTTLEDFARQCVARGAEITALARAPVSRLPAELPGFYARMDATGPWTPVPVLVAAAPPGGPIEQAVFQGFLDEIERRLAAALPLDGVYIASHGASSAVADEDSDGTLAAAVRRIVGPAVPVACSHDLHCNVSERLVESVDAFVAYRTNPHVDMAARAAECADLLRAALAGERYARAFLRLPLAPPTVTLLTASGPYADLVRDAEALMRGDPRIANASVAGGFVYSDLPKCGITVTVTARNGDLAAAREAALKLARRGWAE
ncbi:MAG: M81 family metallopeptidase, partial [Acetobacteraceae bacterium]|nr:M81 family metallopeptidase [Acetobacteraceae bacterium]